MFFHQRSVGAFALRANKPFIADTAAGCPCCSFKDRRCAVLAARFGSGGRPIVARTNFAAWARVTVAAIRARAQTVAIVNAWRAFAVAETFGSASVARRCLARGTGVASVAPALALAVPVDQLPGAHRIAQHVWILDEVARFDVAKVTRVPAITVAPTGVTFDRQRAGLVAPGIFPFASARGHLARLASVPYVAIAPFFCGGEG